LTNYLIAYAPGSCHLKPVPRTNNDGPQSLRIINPSPKPENPSDIDRSCRTVIDETVLTNAQAFTPLATGSEPQNCVFIPACLIVAMLQKEVETLKNLNEETNIGFEDEDLPEDRNHFEHSNIANC
jgi:hypothetical protein